MGNLPSQTGLKLKPRVRRTREKLAILPFGAFASYWCVIQSHQMSQLSHMAGERIKLGAVRAVNTREAKVLKRRDE